MYIDQNRIQTWEITWNIFVKVFYTSTTTNTVYNKQMDFNKFICAAYDTRNRYLSICVIPLDIYLF